VINLNGASTAKGMGVQLLDASSNLLPMSTPKLVGTGSFNYTIPLRARYYQTGSSITTGTANAAATVTMLYQ
jgi:major type 1 subunit fimbrin (pilin)